MRNCLTCGEPFEEDDHLFCSEICWRISEEDQDEAEETYYQHSEAYYFENY